MILVYEHLDVVVQYCPYVDCGDSEHEQGCDCHDKINGGKWFGVPIGSEEGIYTGEECNHVDSWNYWLIHHGYQYRVTYRRPQIP